jgi:hypothetical protein
MVPSVPNQPRNLQKKKRAPRYCQCFLTSQSSETPRLITALACVCVWYRVITSSLSRAIYRCVGHNELCKKTQVIIFIPINTFFVLYFCFASSCQLDLLLKNPIPISQHFRLQRSDSTSTIELCVQRINQKVNLNYRKNFYFYSFPIFLKFHIFKS